MKKLLYVIFTMLVLFGMKEISYAADESSYGDFTYKLENGYAVITGYTGAGGSITIPSSINGYTVCVIGEEAFYQNNNITKIVMPDTITWLERYSFLYCYQLEEIKVSASLEVIEKGSFGGCYKLKEVNLPGTISTIGPECFDFCYELAAINIDSAMQDSFFSIDGVLFFKGDFSGKYEAALVSYPSGKEDIRYAIPEFVTYIRSFAAPQHLKELIIPSNVKDIESYAIYEPKNTIDIYLKHEITDIFNFSDRSFVKLSDGSRIICKNEKVKKVAESYIFENCATAVLEADIGINNPTTALKVTSGESINLEVKHVNEPATTWITWEQQPFNTTENVKWSSSDPTGLSIETYSGKVDARYHGNYTVTGKTDSGHSVSVNINVSAVNNEDVVLIGNDGLPYTKSVAVGEEYQLNYTNFLNLVGIYPETEIIDTWTISDPSSLKIVNSESYFAPKKAGSYTINYVGKDKVGNILVKANGIIQVSRGKTILDGTPSEMWRFNTDSIKLDTKANGNQKLQYTSSNAKVVTVSSDGSVRMIGVGTATITVKVIGDPNYTDAEKKVSIRILPCNLSWVTVKSITTQNYTGKQIKPAVSATYNGYRLQLGKDFNLSYKNNVNIGSGRVTITGINKFSGSKTLTFKINGIKNPSSLIQKKATQSSIEIAWKKVSGATGYQIYCSTKKSGSYKKIATTSNIKYINRRLKSGTTYYYKIRAYKKDSTSSYSAVLQTSTSPNKVNLSLKSKNGKPILTWKAVNGAARYEIYRSTTKGGKYSIIKTLNGSVRTYIDNKVTKNKTYYYKVRAYCLSGKIKSFGSFSSVKGIRCK